ncbi:MAG: ExbD/TolR family protein [Bacteroides sp.]
MAKGKRSVPEINSSSTADIAFLLLIFFLVTTSMDTDMGLARQLPPMPDEDQIQNDDTKIKERNILLIMINRNNELMCNGEVIPISNLRERAKEFIANPYDDADKPERHAVDIPYFGSQMITKNHVISVQNDGDTSYKVYFEVQNELVAAYNELRDEISKSKWNKSYAALTPDQQKAVREIYPQKISEAVPKTYGGKK